jgi:hypothetical protein
LEDVGKPVGPVCFGKTTVGADAAMVSFKSGGRLLTGSAGGAVGIDEFDEPTTVAFGSKGASPATSRPPSIVQNF